MRTPPTACSADIDSERSTSAKIAATNGCRFATRVAREAPIRWMTRNHMIVVSTSGPSVANRRNTQTFAPRSRS